MTKRKKIKSQICLLKQNLSVKYGYHLHINQLPKPYDLNKSRHLPNIENVLAWFKELSFIWVWVKVCQRKILTKVWIKKNANFVKYHWFLNLLTSNIEMFWHIPSALFILTLKMSLILNLGAKLADIFENESKEEKILHWLS